ncbi:hypothetical protein D3H65_09200 [Paraflavitalea soli]|uniref:CHRD domain-containing protein n=1 Tax=Paraflavitalea soli TaxID=2315862 RepID=A0A3B7MIV5_9BACT|nr:hypothetical protein [Paraflavitalea soli]AXY74138.1 hypothetical protein D3H65_09200 [Paraflavitalea soli]
MRKYFISLSILAVAALAACTKGGKLEPLTGATYAVTSLLDGSKLNPATANDTTKASLTGWYDEQTNGFTFTLAYRKDTTVIKLDTLTGVVFFRNTPVAGAIPAKTVPVTVIVNAVSKANISGSFNRGLSGYQGIDTADIQSFINNQWYIVLTSRRFPEGVAGGQVMLSKN